MPSTMAQNVARVTYHFGDLRFGSFFVVHSFNHLFWEISKLWPKCYRRKRTNRSIGTVKDTDKKTIPKSWERIWSLVDYQVFCIFTRSAEPKYSNRTGFNGQAMTGESSTWGVTGGTNKSWWGHFFLWNNHNNISGLSENITRTTLIIQV